MKSLIDLTLQLEIKIQQLEQATNKNVSTDQDALMNKEIDRLRNWLKD